MKKISTNEILKTQVASIISENGYTNNDFRHGQFIGSNITLYQALYDLTDKWENKLKQIANMEYHSPEQKNAKSLVPRFYICGMFDMSEYEKSFPIRDYPKIASNLMTIDVDAQDNQNINIWELREEIFKLPYVFSTIKSVSNAGFYCIIPIEDTHYTKEYYHYIQKLWNIKYGIHIDDKADTIIRARIISWDEDRDKWIKKDSEIDVWNLKEIQKTTKTEVYKQESYSKYDIKEDVSFWENITFLCMKKIIDDGYTVNDYKAWYHLGCELANFDDGYELFYKMSKNYDNSQSDSSIKKRWKGCKASGIDDNLIRKWCGMAKNRYGKNWLELLSK